MASEPIITEPERKKLVTCEECETVHYANGDVKKVSDKRRAERKKLDDYDRLKNQVAELTAKVAELEKELEKEPEKKEPPPPEKKEPEKKEPEKVSEEKPFYLKKGA